MIHEVLKVENKLDTFSNDIASDAVKAEKVEHAKKKKSRRSKKMFCCFIRVSV